MAERPSWLRGAGGHIADRFVWGNNYNRTTGQWNATPGQYIGGVGSRIANLFLPGSGTAATAIYNATQGRGFFGGTQGGAHSFNPTSGGYSGQGGFTDYGSGFGSGSSFGEFGSGWSPTTTDFGAFNPDRPAPSGGWQGGGGGGTGGGSSGGSSGGANGAFGGSYGGYGGSYSGANGAAAHAARGLLRRL